MLPCPAPSCHMPCHMPCPTLSCPVLSRVIEDVVSRAFLATDEEFLVNAPRQSCGSTATTAMILGDRFYSFNVGDSRTILCRSGRAELVSKVNYHTKYFDERSELLFYTAAEKSGMAVTYPLKCSAFISIGRYYKNLRYSRANRAAILRGRRKIRDDSYLSPEI